ncbi:hypothetical protein J1N35_019078 [Gossypium stocksii]|uniref:Uncharacterized protein n=1 Tax=Gossypium stocksii TaxID=47602 RepID=A0A9D3VQ58_9ROSI|nr:hypothetical protein J1N35_019078 [Gossypium stocksii]
MATTMKPIRTQEERKESANSQEGNEKMQQRYLAKTSQTAKILYSVCQNQGGPRHTFHRPCDECTITLEDGKLQLGLSMNESIIMGATIVLDKEDLCETLFEKVPNKFDSGRILMNWLVKIFNKLPIDATEVVKEQYARAFILQLIGPF